MAFQKYALIDRDGTIIVDKVYLSDPEGVEFTPGAIAGLRRLADAGFGLVLVTNQSGVARGLFPETAIARVHERLVSLLGNEGLSLAGIYYCPHGPEDHCACRKPAPGMALAAMRDFGFTASQAVVIGDSEADMGLAENLGAASVRVGGATGVRDFREAAERAIQLKE